MTKLFISICFISVSALAGQGTDITPKLRQIGVPVFAGDNRFDSETNKEEYADRICQFFNFRTSSDYSAGWSKDVVGPMAIITLEKGYLSFKVETVDQKLEPATYSHLECVDY